MRLSVERQDILARMGCVSPVNSLTHLSCCRRYRLSIPRTCCYRSAGCQGPGSARSIRGVQRRRSLSGAALPYSAFQGLVEADQVDAGGVYASPGARPVAAADVAQHFCLDELILRNVTILGASFALCQAGAGRLTESPLHQFPRTRGERGKACSDLASRKQTDRAKPRPGAGHALRQAGESGPVLAAVLPPL